MKYFVIFLLPIILGLTLGSSVLSTNPVFGLSCAIPNMTEHFEESDTIFLGKALSKEYQPNPRHEDRFDAVTLFSIIEPYKGIYQKEIKVISSEWLWGVNFTENSDYVVFANNNDEGFEHALCTLTQLASESNLPEIRKISQSYILPPLVQLEFGANPNAVQCKQNLVLIQKYDGSPACVTSETKKKLIERGWTETVPTLSKGNAFPLPPERTTDSEMKLRKAKGALETAYFNTVNVGNFYIKDVIVGFGTYDNTLVIDIPSEYIGTRSMDAIKQDIRHIVGNDVQIDYVLYDESIARFIPTVMPYLWNQVLNQKGIEYVPKKQTYWNHDDGFAEHDKVCSPIIASNGTELYISTTFDLEPFQITGTYIDKQESSDCHKTWKTDVIMPEPDRVTALWLKNQMIENEN